MGKGGTVVVSALVESPDSNWLAKAKNSCQTLPIRVIREIRGWFNCMATAKRQQRAGKFAPGRRPGLFSVLTLGTPRAGTRHS